MVPPSTELLPSAAPSSVHHFVATPHLDRLAGPGAPQAPRPGHQQQPVPFVSLGAGQVPGVEGAGAGAAAAAAGLAAAARLPAGAGGDLR